MTQPLCLSSLLLVGIVVATAFVASAAVPQPLQPSQCTAAQTQRNPDTTVMSAGRISLNIPSKWRIASGLEEANLKAEFEGAFEQMAQQYRQGTGASHPNIGIKHFTAAQLPERTGWLIVHEFVIPPQKNYYDQMLRDSKQKIDWGRQQGIFERVEENGIAMADGKKVFRTILRHRDGGRTITSAYWSPKSPSIVSQVMVVQERDTDCVMQEVDQALGTIAIK